MELPVSGDWRCNIAPSVSLQGSPLGETPLVFQCVGPGFHQAEPQARGCRDKQWAGLMQWLQRSDRR